MNSEAFKGLSLLGSVMSISCCAVELQQMNIISSQIILGVPPYFIIGCIYTLLPSCK